MFAGILQAQCRPIIATRGNRGVCNLGRIKVDPQQDRLDYHADYDLLSLRQGPRGPRYTAKILHGPYLKSSRGEA